MSDLLLLKDVSVLDLLQLDRLLSDDRFADVGRPSSKRPREEDVVVVVVVVVVVAEDLFEKPLRTGSDNTMLPSSYVSCYT